MSTSSEATPDPAAIRPDRQRTECNACGHRIDAEDPRVFFSFPCHFRAFEGRSFRVWRCPGCRTIHCLDVVDLDYYYGKYPFSDAKLDLIWKIFYINLGRRFIRHGMTREHKFLDYGCGNDLFGESMRRRGFPHCFGYDPYRPDTELGDTDVLTRGPFDYILLQDVIEHVEDPRELLQELDGYLAPNGHILVGTPNADALDLTMPQVFKNEVHAPYHLHIYTREVLERFGEEVSWTPATFYDRSYHDRPWFALNTRAAKCYQDLKDGTFDVFFEPFDFLRAIRSPRWLHLALFGYWLSYRSDMSIMFRKDGEGKT